MDTQTAAVLRSDDLRDMVAHSPLEVRVEADPWTFLTPAQKIAGLRGMVERGTMRGIEALL